MDPTRPAALACLALLLAGCSGGGEGTAAPPEGGPDAPGAATHNGTLPAWSVGAWWVYDTPAGAATYVVAGDDGADWRMATDSPGLAFSDARTDISRLGPVRKSDLAGSQGTDRVEFFRFPLQDGASWTTTWDATEVRVTVAAGAPGVWDFVANRTDGTTFYRYTYVEAEAWFGHIAHHDANGTEDFRLTLLERGHGFTGELVRWDLVEVDDAEGSGGLARQEQFEVPAGTTDLWLDLHLTCAANAQYVVVLQPAGGDTAQSYRKAEACTQVDITGPVVEAPAAGTWVMLLAVVGDAPGWSTTLLQRTLVAEPFP